MGIHFEECNKCGEEGLRTESHIKYNASRDEFYFIWECFHCDNLIYEVVDPSEVDDPEWLKFLCLSCQRWNRGAGSDP
jgi:hypothetical protein